MCQLDEERVDAGSQAETVGNTTFFGQIAHLIDTLHLTYTEVFEVIPYRNLLMMQRDKLHAVYGGQKVKKISGKELANRRKRKIGMAKLYFKVASDWEEVVRLRNEIVKLKQELKGMDSTQSPAAFKTLNTQLSASTQKMDGLVNEAAKAGAMMEGSFKKKIFDASQSVNGFTEKIIAQKAVVKDIEADIKRLGDAYRIALKRNPTSANSKLEEYNAARKVLDEEKATLFGLTQQQAEARLSVKKLRDEYSLYKSDAKGVTEANEGITISWKKALAVIGGAGVLKALGSEIIRVRGEFQAADTAIQTLLGSKEKADALMVQVREYAKISPLEFSDVTAATQMMLGFNIEAERVPRYLQAIGDVSMGEYTEV